MPYENNSPRDYMEIESIKHLGYKTLIPLKVPRIFQLKYKTSAGGNR